MTAKKRLKVDGFALYRLREDALLTQAELAELSGVHEVTISKIESGRVENPRVGTLKALANALEVPVALLYKPGKKDRANSPLEHILAERARSRALGVMTPADPPAMGRWGAAWDFFTSSEEAIMNGDDEASGMGQSGGNGVSRLAAAHPNNKQPRIAP